MTRTYPIFAVLCFFALALTGCIDVSDLGTGWEKGRIDPVLEGRWKVTPAEGIDESAQGDKFFVFEKDGDHYRLSADDETSADKDESILVKTLEAGGHTFLMLYEPRDGAAADDGRPGEIWPYTVKDGTITMTRIVGAQVAEMERISENLVAAEAVGGSWKFTIARLDEPTIAALVRLADVPDLWEVWATGEKVARAEKNP